MKKIKYLIYIAYLVIFVGLVLLETYAVINKFGFSVSSLMYWMLLLGWIWIILNKKWRGSRSLYLAMILYIIGALLAVLGLMGISETLLRVSFVGWLVGIAHVLIETRREGV